MKQFFFILTISLSWAVFTVDALTCFECMNVVSGTCFDDPVVGSVPVTDCEEYYGPGEYVCVQVINTAGYIHEVTTGCQHYETFNEYCAAATEANSAQCLGCRQDLCNSSNNVTPITLLFSVLFLLIIILK